MQGQNHIKNTSYCLHIDDLYTGNYHCFLITLYYTYEFSVPFIYDKFPYRQYK